jgi:hypothetical protein
MSNLVSQEAVIKGIDNSELAFPWVGGLDACQFGALDLDFDGIKDMMVFDRRGNRLMCFINKGIPNVIDYTYAPQFEKYFPVLAEWVIIADYNHDGKDDIFTYSPGFAGMKVYKNVSINQLAFESVVYPYLTSFQGGGYVNILATNADYPSITDVDNDGDLDILTFWALGGFIELHNNQSIEKYGTADSLDFIKTDFCWGKVAENEENNELFLDSCLFNKELFSKKARHRGATFQVRDFTGDGLIDCVLADVDYPNLVLLINGRTVEEVVFTSQDTAFPSDNVPVHLFSMPVTAIIDVNNDGADDMLVSPFDPNPLITENKTSVWLYLNIGTNEIPAYQLVSKNFLQGNMIDIGSVSIPLLFDVNGDNLLDMLIGNFGKYDSSYYAGQVIVSRYISQLTYYQNIGSANAPVFKLFSEDFAGLSALNLRGLSPAMADINLDGNPDLLVGCEEGTLIYVEQSHNQTWIIKDTNFGLIDAGMWSSPQLYDLDQDETVDLIIGSESGKLTFYKGTLVSNGIQFQFITDNLGNVDVTDYNLSYTGYSVPWFFKIADNNLNLVVGSEKGKVFHFDQITGNLEGSFREISSLETLLDTIIPGFDVGARSAACLADIDHDGSQEMIVGNFSGGLQLFNSSIPVVPFIRHSTVNQVFEIFPNPTTGVLNVRILSSYVGKIQLSLYSISGQEVYRESIPPYQEQFQIELKGFKPGMYWMGVKGSDFFEIEKIIIW